MPNRIVATLFAAMLALAAHAGPLQKARLDIKGMDCPTCPITIKVLLERQPGVEKVKVDATRHTAEVRFDVAKVSREQLAAVVTQAGYPTTAAK
jgi:mercuric ion binding protein